ncbi:MAG: hypothetical protein ACJ73S_22685 [Mycobacteriales bacterium]
MAVRVARLVAMGVVVVAGVAACGGGSGGSGRARSTPRAPASHPGTAPAGTPPATGAPAGAATTLHYVSNTHGDWSAPAKLGYNLIDLGPDTGAVNALPAGIRALVWLGNLDNTSCTPGYSWDRFTAAVDRLAGNPKVFGYYLSDEPHPAVCRQAVEHIRQRADYIRARDPAQKSFIVVLGAEQGGCVPTCEYQQLNPANTHVDLFGIDPFPCNNRSGCHFEKIDAKVDLATKGGIPVAAMVPLFQAFGQTCNSEQDHYYTLPTVDQLRQMLARWDALVPHPVFDFTYTWASQGPSCPSLDVANGSGGNADLQSVLRARNGR